MDKIFQPTPFEPSSSLREYIIHVAKQYPEREVLLILRDTTTEADATLTSITWYKLLADVRSRADYLVRTTGLGPRSVGSDIRVVGLLARNNFQYFITLTAMIMLRWTIVLISTRNSTAAVTHLMHSTGSEYLLVDEDLPSQTDDEELYKVVHISKETITPHVEEDGLTYWDDLPHTDEAAARDLLDEASRTCLYMHTSGSTGHPKPIAWTHEFVIRASIAMGRDRFSRAGEVMYTPLPLFHGGGFCLCYPNILGGGGVYTFIDTHRPISSDNILRHIHLLRHRKIDILLAPSILEDIFDSSLYLQESLPLLKSLNSVIWGGAPLREDAGRSLSQDGVPLVAWCGVTEVGVLARSCFDPESDPNDWSYLKLVDDYAFNFERDDSDSEDLKYRLIISPGFITPPVINHNDPPGFVSNDVWMRHPDPRKTNLWKPVGRLDDVTVLSNGEKTDNKQLENLLGSSELISRSVIFGTGRFLNGAILIPASPITPYTPKSVSAFIDDIWPHIETHVNRVVTQHSRLLRPLVLVATPDKPFLVSDKGTIKATASLLLYEDEINAAYHEVEEGVNKGAETSPLPFNASDIDGVKLFVGSLVVSALGHSLGEDKDFFAAGMDSLLATQVRSAANASLKDAGYSTVLPKDVVYINPTVAAFARYLQSFISDLDGNGDETTVVRSTNSIGQDTGRTLIEQTIAEFTSHFPEHHPQCPPIPSDDLDVYIVTGTTGSLGATFVSLLLQKPEVKKIYLMNRSSSSASVTDRQRISFENKGLDYQALDRALQENKAVHIEIDFSKKGLGLDEAVHCELASQVTHIVHLAWLLDFNLILSSYQIHISGVRGMIDLALSSRRKTPPHLTFLSSIGVVGRWPHAYPAPEALLESSEYCLPHGYAYAKYVSEKVIQSAVLQRQGLRASIVRSGQISGALRTGAWSRKEYMPTLMQASVYLVMLPDDLPAVRWLPVDIAADVLYCQIQHGASDTSAPLTFYNLENVLSTPWPHVVKAITKFCPDKEMKRIPMHKWLEYVRNDGKNPAFKLLEFFEENLFRRSLPTLDTTIAKQAAGNRVEYEVDEALIASYVAYACADISISSSHNDEL